jgi:hypothetical protein
MSINNFIPDDGSLWSIRAVDISGNYNQKLTLDAAGNAIIRTGNTDRLTINSSGAWTCQGGMSYNNATNTLTAGTFSGAVSGTARSATNIAGGAGGQIPYQSAANNTAFLAIGTAGQVLTSAGTTLAPTWTTPVSNNIIMEDFDMFETTSGFVGSVLSFAESGNGNTTYFNGTYEAAILNGSLYRRGLVQLFSGTANPSSTQNLTDLLFSYANISKVTFGIVPHGNQNLSTATVAAGNITQSLGITSATNLTAAQTSNTVIWRMTSSNATIPTWQFVINNVVQYTLTITPGDMTAKWCRAEIAVVYGGGSTATVTGTWYNLTDGTSETTGTYTITAGTGFPAPLTTPNTVGIYIASYSNNATAKYMGVDYVELQQPNLYPVGSGTTDTTGR